MEQIETSESTANLDVALAKAQGEIDHASKDKVNPAFRSKYADLTAVWSAIRPALSKNGIAITQWPIHSDDERLHIITRLAHSGEWIRAHFSIPVMKKDAHGYGSAVTYAKRFSLAAAVGVVADDDDDGNAAAAAKPNGQSKVTGLPTAPISPVDGSLDALSPAERKEANHIASLIVDCFETGKEFTAYEAFYQSNLSNEMKLGIWEVLKPHSKIRNTLKKMDLETKVAQQA